MDPVPVCTMSWPQVAAILLCAGCCLGLAASRQLRGNAGADGQDRPPRAFLVVAAIAFVLASGPLIGGQGLMGCQRAAAAKPSAQIAP
jgi:hypothetical protein